MIMVHADDTGLILPPRVAPTQVVIIPIVYAEGGAAMVAKAHELAASLRAVGVRVEVDDRDNYNPGWKFAHWEVKGVPVRIELGPKDMAASQAVARRRDQEKKDAVTVAWDQLPQRIPAMLDTMQAEMLERARAEALSRRRTVHTWSDFTAALDARCTALAPHCDVRECEKEIKRRSGDEAKLKEEGASDADAGEKLTGAAKSLCIPFEQPAGGVDGKVCVGCGQAAKHYTLFGRSY
jgi:prolyl-tRNA synthetase